MYKCKTVIRKETFLQNELLIPILCPCAWWFLYEDCLYLFSCVMHVSFIPIPCAWDNEWPALPHYLSLSLLAEFRARLTVATAAKFQVVPEIEQNMPYWEANAAVKVEKAHPGSGPHFVPDTVPTLDFRRSCNCSRWSFYRLSFQILWCSQGEKEGRKKKKKGKL